MVSSSREKVKYFNLILHSCSEGDRGGARGAMAPQYFGHASPRKFRKSSYKGLYLASKPRFQNDKVLIQILKAMQIPEAQFLIINAHFHKKN